MDFQAQRHGRPRRLNAMLGNLIISKPDGAQLSGSKRYIPPSHLDRIDFLSSQRFVVQKQLSVIAVRVRHHAYRRARRPVPVRQQMQERLFREKRLVQIERVLLKPAGVQNAPMRADRWPLVWRGLASIVKTGPGKQSRDEWPLCSLLPRRSSGRAP